MSVGLDETFQWLPIPLTIKLKQLSGPQDPTWPALHSSPLLTLLDCSSHVQAHSSSLPLHSVSSAWSEFPHLSGLTAPPLHTSPQTSPLQRDHSWPPYVQPLMSTGHGLYGPFMPLWHLSLPEISLFLFVFLHTSFICCSPCITCSGTGSSPLLYSQ